MPLESPGAHRKKSSLVASPPVFGKRACRSSRRLALEIVERLWPRTCYQDRSQPASVTAATYRDNSIARGFDPTLPFEAGFEEEDFADLLFRLSFSTFNSLSLPRIQAWKASNHPAAPPLCRSQNASRASYLSLSSAPAALKIFAKLTGQRYGGCRTSSGSEAVACMTQA